MAGIVKHTEDVQEAIGEVAIASAAGTILLIVAALVEDNELHAEDFVGAKHGLDPLGYFGASYEALGEIQDFVDSARRALDAASDEVFA